MMRLPLGERDGDALVERGDGGSGGFGALDRCESEIQPQLRQLDGRNVTSRLPNTEIWCLLYARVLQADGR
jgi:hypothetical protein